MAIIDYLHESKNLPFRRGQLFYRGVTVPHGLNFEPNRGQNFFVYSSLDGARNYAQANWAGIDAQRIILTFSSNIDLNLAGLDLFGITKELYMSNVIKGNPQDYQRDHLIQIIEKTTKVEFDGYYDFKANELLLKNHCLVFVRSELL